MPASSIDVASLLFGILLGAAATLVVSLLIFRRITRAAESERDAARGESTAAELRRTETDTRAAILQQSLDAASKELGIARGRIEELASALSSAQASLSHTEERLRSQKQEMDALHQTLLAQFQNLASRILNDNAQLLRDQHADKLEDILRPLKEKIDRFEQRVEETHRASIRDNQSLKEQIAALQSLNQSIGEEAKNLTKALTGQAKVRGNWGEMILEKFLESSGLCKGREFEVQVAERDADGRRLQPDVVLLLPDARRIVVDAKVSLVAYERYCNASDEEIRCASLKEHVAAVRRHVTDLGGKNYHQLYGIDSPEFVLMFVPVETAYADAMNADPELFQQAYGRNVVIVSGTTLLATLKTIAGLWRTASQNRHAQEIARLGGELFDRFTAFADTLMELGRKLASAQQSYDDTVRRLRDGRGNLIAQAQKLRTLGVAATRELPGALLTGVDDEAGESP